MSPSLQIQLIYRIFEYKTMDKRQSTPVTKSLHPLIPTPAAEEVEQALSRNAAGWRARAPNAPVPMRDWLLVFVGDDVDGMRMAAAGAAVAGFERGAILQDGLQAFGQAALQQVHAHPIFTRPSEYPLVRADIQRRVWHRND